MEGLYSREGQTRVLRLKGNFLIQAFHFFTGNTAQLQSFSIYFSSL